MNKRRVLIFSAVLALAAVLMILLKKNDSENGALQVSGNVEVTETNLGFKIPGRIASLEVEEGVRVSKGDRIAVLDDRELRSLVEQYRATVGIADAEEVRAKKDYDRFEALHEQEAISGQQLDSARRARDAAVSQVRQAKAALAASEERLQDTVIHSPISGVVLRKNSEVGEMIAAGSAVYTLGDIDHLWIKVYVKEDNMGIVKLGQKALVTVDSFPNKKFAGMVSFISSEAEFTPKNIQTKEDRVKLVFGVKVTVENQNDELKPGMPADVTILVK